MEDSEALAPAAEVPAPRAAATAAMEGDIARACALASGNAVEFDMEERKWGDVVRCWGRCSDRVREEEHTERSEVCDDYV